MKKLLHFGYQMLRKIFYFLPIRNIIIFESSDDYDGNAKSVYQYLVDHSYDKKYTLVWAAKNIKNIPNDGHCKKIKYMGHGIKNLYYENSAKYVFFDNMCPVTKVKKTCTRIYLTHACPILKNCKDNIHAGNCCDYALCTSSNIIKTISEQFNVDESKIFLNGLPRNDILFKNNKEITKIIKNKSKKVILWMPTFRIFKHEIKRKN